MESELAGGIAGLDTDLADPFGGKMHLRALARKEPVGGTCHFPVGAQKLQEVGREHHIAVFPPLSQLNADRLPIPTLEIAAIPARLRENLLGTMRELH
jgi:hypothetical protein